ncbi:MAG: hypothetical protein LLF83_10085 [Methanobacterium sp.]|nr:hypothetical protein [Methanobacterium sp.]
MNIFKINVKLTFIIYFLLDTLLVGIGMGVPIFNILLGFLVGWYVIKRITLSKRDLKEIITISLKYGIYSSLVTFIWMLIIWGPISTMLLNPYADYANFGIPMILYDPKISFIGWIILMVFISPFLQLLTTVFASQITLWRLIRKNKI